MRIGADGRVEFDHPLFASAVYSSASLSDRRATHRALAAEVSDPEEVARHLALGCDGEDEQVALEVERAARLARSRGAPDTAAELTELALRLVPEGSPAVDGLRLDLARHLYFAGDFQRAAGLLEELRRDLGPGDLRAEALLAQSDIDYWRRGESAAVALAEEALEAARDRLLRARCHAAIAMYAGTVDLQKAAAAARAALDLLEELPDADPGLVAAALGAGVRADLFLGEGFDAEAAERAFALERGSPPATVDTRMVFQARPVAPLRRRPRRCPAAPRAGGAGGARGGRRSGARQHPAQPGRPRVLGGCLGGRPTSSPTGWSTPSRSSASSPAASSPSGGRTWTRTSGGVDAVRAAAGREARPEEPIVADDLGSKPRAGGARRRGVRGGRPKPGRGARRSSTGSDFREPAVWRVDGDAIEAAVAVGDLERAAALLARFEERAARSGIPWSLAVSARCRALVLAVGGELEPAAEALERALAEHERCPVPFERARTLLVQGQVLRRLKRKRGARSALEEALAIFRRLGAEPWVTRAEEELRRVAVRRAPGRPERDRAADRHPGRREG